MSARIDHARNGAARPLVGQSAWVRGIQAEIAQVAPYRSSILITGPSGTGKELLARAIHDNSPRAEEPFVAVNCAAISGTLFESHMFGHLKGAFTGSNYEALGCFRAADGGTIFLDEVGELDLGIQAKLLRVLQEGTVVPVGSHEEKSVDVRVLAATNRCLTDEIASGSFREDLYYRLAVVSLDTHPLCRRPEDIEPLTDYFLARQSVQHGLPFKPLSEQALQKLHLHHWPGNVRELQNVLERSAMLARGAMIEATDIRFDQVTSTSEIATEAESDDSNELSHERDGRWLTYEEYERDFIAATLRRTNFNQTAAARLLNLDRSVLRRRIKKLGLAQSATAEEAPS